MHSICTCYACGMHLLCTKYALDMHVAAAAGGPDANSTNMGLLVSEMGVTKDVWWMDGRPVAVYVGIRKIHSASGQCCIILNEAFQPFKWLPTI